MRSRLFVSAAILVAAEVAASANAQVPNVTLSLDLFFTNAQDNALGGSWQLLALGSHEGLANVNAQLLGTRGADDAFYRANSQPQRSVTTAFQTSINGVPWNADQDANPATLDMLFAQVPVPSPGPQDLIYGAGVTTINPDELGLSVDTTGVNMNQALLLAGGTFAPGNTPTFGPSAPSANVFTQQGTGSDPPPAGSIVNAAVPTQTRSNVATCPGDAVLDKSVSGTEVQRITGNFMQPGNFIWQEGDVSGDKRVSNLDYGYVFGNFGASANNPPPIEPPPHAQLKYDSTTGIVVLDPALASGAKVTTYALESDGAFLPDAARTSSVALSPFFFTNTPDEVSETDLVFQGTSNIIDLGKLLPPGLTKAQLESTLKTRSYVGEIATGLSEFDLVVVGADFTEGGAVDFIDYLSWQARFGLADGATHLLGDADGDRDVDGNDFLVWQQQFGSVVSPAAAAVPELTAWALALALLALPLASRKREGGA